MNKLASSVVLAILLGACVGAEDSSIDQDVQNPDLLPSGKDHLLASNAAGTSTGGSPIKYHGGPIITGTVNVYYIWYGNWGTNSAPSILTTLAQNIGGSPYYRINTKYYNGSKQYVSGNVALAGQAYDAGSLGTTLDDNGVLAVASNAIAAGALPEDPNGLYFVLTSSDVHESSGFCTSYCGWHWYGNDLNGHEIRYAFVGDADVQCPSGCMAQTTGPNGNPGADGMASVIAHELEEANTDPRGTAWYDGRGYENADKCAWTFGTTYTTANGAKANMKLGGLDFLIQRNWKLDTQSCGLQ